MFVGHYAVALGAKKAAPRVSLGTLFFAAQLLDLIWPILLLLGFEHVRIAAVATAFTPLDFYDYPITHSLMMALIWAVLFGVVFWWRRRDLRATLVLATCVLSHWVLDFVSHGPDLPIAPGSHRYVGLGLWNSVAATVAVELATFAIGLITFLSASRAKDAIGRWAFWIFICFTLALYAGNIFAGPPPGVKQLAWFGMTQWLIVPWAYWIDRHRTVERARK